MATKVKIISLAFNLLGQESINEIQLDKKWHGAASDQFDSLYDEYQSNYAWLFSTTILNCSPDSTPPPITTWSYQYTIPVDALVIYYIENAQNYKIFGNKIFTNVNNINLIYRSRKQVSDMPSFFASLMKYGLTAAMAMPMTKQSDLIKVYEAKADTQLIIARHIDGSQQPNNVIQATPLIDVRWRANPGNWIRC